MIPGLSYRRAADTGDLDERARMLALLAPEAIDRHVDAEVAAAVRERRIEDAVSWQRIRLRAHRLRAVGATSACRG